MRDRDARSRGAPEDMPASRPTLGGLELDTLQYISGAAPVSVGEVASGFGEPRGLARTTVLTVMERLRLKGYLTRRKEGAVYRYAPRVAAAEVLKGLVRDFVDRTLGGSLEPFVAYLSESRDLTPDEAAQLRKLVDGLPGGGGGEG